jgi:hypothetical protein
VPVIWDAQIDPYTWEAIHKPSMQEPVSANLKETVEDTQSEETPAKNIAKQIFCCERRKGLNNFRRIGYCFSRFISLLHFYKLFVAELLKQSTRIT